MMWTQRNGKWPLQSRVHFVNITYLWLTIRLRARGKSRAQARGKVRAEGKTALRAGPRATLYRPRRILRLLRS